MLKIRFTYFILPSCIANGYISFLLAVFYATRWFHLPFIPSACLLERRKRKNGAEKVREPHILHLHTNTNVNNLEANEKLHKTENSGREREKKKASHESRKRIQYNESTAITVTQKAMRSNQDTTASDIKMQRGREEWQLSE